MKKCPSLYCIEDMSLLTLTEDCCILVTSSRWTRKKQFEDDSKIHLSLPPSGDARLFPHWRGHPGGLVKDGVLPGCHASQQWATGQKKSAAEGLDVESDPGKCPASFSEPHQCQRLFALLWGAGDQRSHFSRTGCWPAPEKLLVLVFFLLLLIIHWMTINFHFSIREVSVLL